MTNNEYYSNRPNGDAEVVKDYMKYLAEEGLLIDEYTFKDFLADEYMLELEF